MFIVHDMENIINIADRTNMQSPMILYYQPQIPNAGLIPIDCKTSLIFLTLLVSMRPAMHILAFRAQLKLANIT